MGRTTLPLSVDGKSAPYRWPKFVGRVALVGVLATCLVLVAWEAGRVAFGPNVHTVVPGQIYRSAQLSPRQLREVVHRYRIRAVINLRGSCPHAGWYRREGRTLEELDVAQYDVLFPTYVLPTLPQMQQLVQTLDTCEYPLLLHCRRGADRTGLASAVALLLQSEASPAEARAQLSWRFGHLPLFRRSELRQLIPMYEAWLAEQGQSHQPERFRQWVQESYRPGHRWAEIEPLEVPTRLQLGRRAAATFRVHNRSRFPWHLRQSANCGVHLRYVVKSLDGSYEATGGAGYFDEVVPPGKSIDLTVSLPAIRTAGRYTLFVDMLDEDRGWFFPAGSEPFITELEVSDTGRAVPLASSRPEASGTVLTGPSP